MNITFKKLTPTEFEEFCYDLLDQLGFINIDWRKGTGKNSSPSDRGRDIVFQKECNEVDGSKYFETWFTDCKHYTKGVPPKELQNLLTWAEAERPDYVLFMVSGFLSNSAKDYLEQYKTNRKPPFKIKYWEKPILEKLSNRRMSLLRKYNLTTEPLKAVKKILKAEEEFNNKIWYSRHQLLKQMVKKGHPIRPDIWKGALKSAKETENKYGKKNLGPYDDFEWGMINGKLSALRWVLGDDWDMLDT